MKKLLVFIFLVISYVAQAQDLPTMPANGFAFPICSKFVIKLIPTDSINYDYSVLSFEPFEEVVDMLKNEDLFADEGEDNTIVFYFCFGTFGEMEKEKDEKMRVLLLMKNYSKIRLNYSSDIQREEDGEFEETSNVGTSPNVRTIEMWPYMIHYIGLKEFRKDLDQP